MVFKGFFFVFELDGLFGVGVGGGGGGFGGGGGYCWRDESERCLER